METDRQLRGGLTIVEDSTFGFGTMVGVGWRVLIDDGLSRGGYGGAMPGSLISALGEARGNRHAIVARTRLAQRANRR